MMWKCAFSLWLAAAPAVACAAPVSVVVVGADGKPVAGAVVTVTMPGVAAPAPRGSYTVAQRNIAFEPHVVIVPVGATVGFPNLDKVRHHVYSFSRPKRFDLKLYGREDTRTVTFDKPGVVALGCNIHDRMSGIVFVTDTPFAAITDAAGRAMLNNVPAGRGTVTVWSPAIRAADNAFSQPLAVTAAGASATLTIRR